MTTEATEYITVKIKEADALLSHVWLRPVNSEEYRAGLTMVGEQIMQHNIRLWLADSRKLGSVLFEDQQWLTNKWIPGMLDSKLQKVARVVSSDVFTYISFEQQMDKAIKAYGFQTQTEQFTSSEAALSWLYMQE